MSFMQPVVEHGEYYEVETSQGTWFVPADVVGTPSTIEDLAPYVEGEIDEDLAPYVEGEIDEDQELTKKTGWLARMFAPGYMDCTDWCAYDSEADAWESLASDYGGEPGGFTTYRLPADWASYFVNADATGLADSEQDEADEWIAEHPELDHMSPNVIGDPFFVVMADNGAKGCDVCVYVFHVLNEDDPSHGGREVL